MVCSDGQRNADEPTFATETPYSAAGCRIDGDWFFDDIGGGASGIAWAAAPPSAKSYYVTGYDLTWAYDAGCDAGTKDKNNPPSGVRTVVLDFGSMFKTGTTWKFSVFGGTPVTRPQARDMTAEFSHGYYVCTGTNTTVKAYIALGTNNSGALSNITAEAGDKFATTVTNAVSKTKESGRQWYKQGIVIGGNDFEAWGNTSRNAESIAWINAYSSYAGSPIIVNYGSADGCPSSGSTSGSSCNLGLVASTIIHVSWISPKSWPLPEIYSSSGTQSKQWKLLSKYSISTGHTKFAFRGVMAQSGACSQVGGCSGTNNSPATAWNQLNNEINSDPTTATNPGPPTNIWWTYL